MSEPVIDTTSSAASQLMAIEVISGLLVSTSPRELGRVLTDHLRELTGAKTAMVLAHRSRPHGDELLHVSPKRRTALFSPEELEIFCYQTTPGELPYSPEDLPAGHPIKAKLLTTGIGSMARFALKCGGELIGLLLLLDLPEIERFAETTRILNLLAPPIALALKNALAYAQIELSALELEKRVEERTAQLLQKNGELLQSEERFRRATEEAPFPIMIHASDGEVLALSRAWMELSGYTRADIPTVAAWAEKAYGIRKEPVLDEMNSLYRLKRRRAEGESTIACRDGSTRVWDFHSVSLGELPDGRLTAMSMASDVTERRSAQENLVKSEHRNRSILQTAMEGFWLVDAERYILETNDAYCQMSGYRKQELQGMQVADLEVDDGEAEIAARSRRIMEQGGDLFESRHRRKDGSIFFVEVSIKYLPFDNGRYAVFVRDITERKLAEERLGEARALLQAALDCSPAGIVIAGAPDGRLRYVNDAGLSIGGGDRLRLAEGVGIERYLADWQLPEGEGKSLPTEEVPLFRAIRHGETNSREFLIRHADRDDRAVLANAAPIRDRFGAIQAGILVFTDLTDIKKVEKEKHKLESQLQQAQKMESVGRLAGGVAHDFNNMLSVIIGHAELALMVLEPAHQVCADLQEILSAAQRSADLTRQLLAFARKQTIAPKVLDLNETIARMLKMLGRLIGEDIQLDWRPAPEIWPVRVDPTQIDQILANLCVNARDAIAGNGRITIETANSAVDEAYCALNPEAACGEYVCLSLTDSGCGMDPETRSHIFEPFYTTKEMGKGTGLGLATVYGAVKQNKGFITVCSEPGAGTTFSVYLPREAGCGNIRTLPGDEAKSRGGRETILLVEDEPGILAVVSTILETRGYLVLKAERPGTAIRMALEHAGEIHLLMTDVVMPEMNGRDLAGRLSALHPKMKLLFMSGYTADVIANKGVLDRDVHFIQKPFLMSEMAALVRDILDGKEVNS